jgi:hypothetical protein
MRGCVSWVVAEADTGDCHRALSDILLSALLRVLFLQRRAVAVAMVMAGRRSLRLGPIGAGGLSRLFRLLRGGMHASAPSFWPASAVGQSGQALRFGHSCGQRPASSRVRLSYKSAQHSAPVACRDWSRPIARLQLACHTTLRQSAVGAACVAGAASQLISTDKCLFDLRGAVREPA